MNKIISWIVTLILVPVLAYTQVTPRQITLGIHTKEAEKCGHMALGTKLAVLCKNPNKLLKGKINQVAFYIGKEGMYNAPFKVHIYSVNVADTTPGKDLIMDNLVVTADTVGWFKVNVSNYGIDVPADGFFVAMEWIYTKADYMQRDTASSNNDGFTTQNYGQTIGTVTDDPNMRSLTYFKDMGGRHWGKFILPDEQGKNHVINALIQAEITVKE
jgi:hypothetical protein